MDRNELFDLIPAYALGALDPEEQAAVETLLQGDAEAQRELVLYQDISRALVLATPARRAPVHLGDDLRRRLAAERTATAPVTTQKQRPARRVNIWASLLAAAAVLAVVIAGTLLLNGRDPGEQLYAQIVAQAGFQQVTIENSAVASGDIVVSPDGQQAVIRLTRLPQLEAAQTFQLWLIDAAGAQSGGLFPFSNPQATYYMVVPLEKSAGQYDAFGVSVEPEGGSPLFTAPSTAPIFAVSTKG